MFPFNKLGSAFRRPRAAASAPNLRKGAALLAASGLWTFAGTAFAGNANVLVKVTALPEAASVSRTGLPTYAAYQVVITSQTANVINGVRFSGETNDGAPPVPGPGPNPVGLYNETSFVSPSTVTCGPPTPIDNKFQCDIGQLAGGATVSFVAVFNTPTAVSPMQLEWKLQYSNGSTSSTTTPSSLYCTEDGTTYTNVCKGTRSTGLITGGSPAQKKGFQTFIPYSSESTFFTGNGSALSTDLGLDASTTTKLTFPKNIGLRTALVDQVVTNVGANKDVTTSIATTVTVPNMDPITGLDVNFNAEVTVELRRDASTITGGKIANVLSYMTYSHDGINNYPIYDCAKIVGELKNQTPPVCLDLSRSQVFTKKTAPTPNDVGDWSLIIRAWENGAFRY